MEDGQEVKIDPNLRCKVCGESDFNLREGFYYCRECGTKQEQVRDIEVVQEEDFNNDKPKHVKKQKIWTIKAEKPEVTSWEIYNYILRGMVEELLSYGAKEELKLMTLQIWAAYLRRMEVAFFNKKHSQLPKLGVRFIKRDAKVLYNHSQERARKRKRRCTETSNEADSRVSARKWRKSKRQLDESTYSVHSATQSANSSGNMSASQSSGTHTASTGTTAGAIRLQFSAHARGRLKRIMPPKHVDKHEKDAKLTCHKIRPLARALNRVEHAVHTMNIKQIYAILGIALNLIEDELQLSDLVRFINEDHIGTRNVLHYFPENVAAHGKKLLQEIDFYRFPQKYNDKMLRDHSGLLVRFIQIKAFKPPNVSALVLRYVTELDLPPAVATFGERLVNLMPPQFKTRAQHSYPAYEARAMAYVLFVMKLLFGLDGHKEKLISKAAQKLNKRLKQLNSVTTDSDSDGQQHAPLFVWSDWMEYIEMRKIIVAQHNVAFGRQFKENRSTTQVLEDLAEEQRRENEENVQTDAITGFSAKAANLKRIFEKFQERYAANTPEKPAAERLVFPPTFTPAHEYFKRILLHCDMAPDKVNVRIPEFMRVDHAQHTLQPFLESKKLRAFLSRHDCQLKVLPTACSKKRCFVGVFRTPVSTNSNAKGPLRAYFADFQISEQLWLKDMASEPPSDELEFKTNLDSYDPKYQHTLEVKAAKRKQCEGMFYSMLKEDDKAAIGKKSQEKDKDAGAATKIISEEIPIENFLMPSTLFRDKLKTSRKGNTQPNFDTLSLHSIDVFSEYNMDPIKDFNLKEPRRNLDSVDLFSGLGYDDDAASGGGGAESSQTPTCDDENESFKREILNSDDEDVTANATTSNESYVTLVTSNLDCWVLLGGFASLTSVQKKILEDKFSRTFFWMLETCAHTIGVDWSVLYEQLLAIELMFIYGIESLDEFHNCVYYRYNNTIKDFNMLLNTYREIW